MMSAHRLTSAAFESVGVFHDFVCVVQHTDCRVIQFNIEFSLSKDITLGKLQTHLFLIILKFFPNNLIFKYIQVSTKLRKCSNTKMSKPLVNRLFDKRKAPTTTVAVGACVRAYMLIYWYILSSIAHKTNGGRPAKRKMTAINFHI